MGEWRDLVVPGLFEVGLRLHELTKTTPHLLNFTLDSQYHSDSQVSLPQFLFVNNVSTREMDYVRLL